MQIYFDTATYDEIEKDVKVSYISLILSHVYLLMQVTIESLVSMIGGTMGLLTGFSILSGVEIVYFVGKFIFSTIERKIEA